MNDRINKLLVTVTCAAGLAGAWLRRGMMVSLVSQGLLPRDSFYAGALWILTGGLLLALVLLTRHMGADGNFAQAFGPCNIRFGLGAVGGALVLAQGVISLLAVNWQSLDRNISLLSAGMMSAAGVCMILGALSRRTEKAPLPLYHIVVCVGVLVRLFLSFRGWSADPQLHDYVIQLLAMVCLMQFARLRANCDAQRIHRRTTGITGLMAAYFSIVSLSGDSGLFYLGCALWAIGAGPNLGHLTEQAEPPAEDQA